MLKDYDIELRPITESDMEYTIRFLNCQYYTRFTQQGIYPTTPLDMDNFNNCMQKPNLYLAIYYKDKLDYFIHAGNICLFNVHQIFRSAEISLFLWKQGNGYGTKAIKILTEHAFNRMNLNRLSMGAAAANIACIKAFEKNGYKQNGLLHEAYYFDRKYQNVIIMERLKNDEWENEKC